MAGQDPNFVEKVFEEVFGKEMGEGDKKDDKPDKANNPDECRCTVYEH